MRCVWAPKGDPREVPTPGKNLKIAITGAIQYPTGELRYEISPRCTTAPFCLLLDQLGSRARRTGRRILLVLDNGRAHKTAAAQAMFEKYAHEIEVVWLPTYSSQINWIERFWRTFKDTFLANILYDSIETFESVVRDKLDLLRQRPTAVKQLLVRSNPIKRLHRLRRPA